jgi:hypothetical protein
MDADEYWRFPVETLYDETGDCEDTSFLFASVAEAMGYDAVILMLPGHAAVGIASDQASGAYFVEGERGTTIARRPRRASSSGSCRSD